jgi:hypothetical protein
MKSGTSATRCWRRITFRARHHEADEREDGGHHRRSDRLLEHHAVVAKDTSFDIKVLPSWRPDKAFNIEQATFNDYMAKLAEVSIPTSVVSPTCKPR